MVNAINNDETADKGEEQTSWYYGIMIVDQKSMSGGWDVTECDGDKQIYIN